MLIGLYWANASGRMMPISLISPTSIIGGNYLGTRMNSLLGAILLEIGCF